MAYKRMFNNDVVGSDHFLEMPATSQALYFHLGMRADDDGFVNPNTTMRMTGSNKNDLDILLGKKFVIQFQNGVLVIKHHRMNNNWNSRDCKRTVYTEEFAQLYIKENRAYTLDGSQGELAESGYRQLPKGNTRETPRQNRIEENRIVGEQSSQEVLEVQEIQEKPRTPSKYPHSKEVFSWFPSPQKSWGINTTELKHAELLYDRGENSVKSALQFHAKHEDYEDRPKITKPSDLERKWEDLIEFGRRNNI